MAQSLNLEAVIPLVDAMINKDGKLVCLDGRSCAGKTTIAGQLKEHYGCGVVHMDDFFLPDDKRTQDCNIDFSRLRKQVTKQLYLKNFEYQGYCCKTATFSSRRVQTTPFVLIEGCYCLHPDTGLCPDLRLFGDISAHEQKQRLLQRNGEEGYTRFRDMWLPREEAYFREFGLPGTV